jgi:segregation and condensation protein A
MPSQHVENPRLLQKSLVGARGRFSYRAKFNFAHKRVTKCNFVTREKSGVREVQLGRHAPSETPAIQIAAPARFALFNQRAGSVVSSHPMPADYKVRLEVFEGPLDLLLYLIKRDEVDIYDISLERITQQYLEFMDAFKVLDLDVAGEFVVMAANLIYLKSRSLLPASVQPPEEETEEEDPRWELVRQLLEYKKFKEAAQHLHEREVAQQNLFGRLPEGPEAVERPLGEVSVFDLINAFNNVVKRLDKQEDLREIFEERFTVSDKIEVVMKLTSSGTPLKFTELFSGMASRTEVVVTFLAILELIRLKQLRVTQQEMFGEIELRRVAG